jgi:hypothetical protein
MTMRVPHARLLMTTLSASALWLAAATPAAEWPAARVGRKEVWDAATESLGQRRFIPMQLVVPGVWDGIERIDVPPAEGVDGEGSVRRGPEAWRHPHTGQVVHAYDRRRKNRREGAVEQKMVVRNDGTAIGRAYDSRSGGLVCDQEAKFPLGLWKQGEVREFEYPCWGTRGGRTVELRRAARITIEALDFEHEGVPHSLRFAWRFYDADRGEMLDQRTYVLVPGRGLVAALRG